MKPIDYKMRKLNENLTLDVQIRLTREFKMRMWLARMLLNMARKVLGCGLKTDIQVNTDG